MRTGRIAVGIVEPLDYVGSIIRIESERAGAGPSRVFLVDITRSSSKLAYDEAPRSHGNPLRCLHRL